MPFLSSLSSRDLKHMAGLGRTVAHAAEREAVVGSGGSVGFHLVLEGSAEVDLHGAARPAMTVGEHFFSGLEKKNPGMYEPIVQSLCARMRSSEALET